MIDVWDSLIRTVLALAVVLVCIGIVAFVARRVMGPRAKFRWPATGSGVSEWVSCSAQDDQCGGSRRRVSDRRSNGNRSHFLGTDQQYGTSP